MSTKNGKVSSPPAEASDAAVSGGMRQMTLEEAGAVITSLQSQIGQMAVHNADVQAIKDLELARAQAEVAEFRKTLEAMAAEIERQNIALSEKSAKT